MLYCVASTQLCVVAAPYVLPASPPVPLMYSSRSRLATWLVAASVLLGSLPASAQVATLTAAAGQSPTPGFINHYTATSYNPVNGLPNGTTQLQFAPIGSATITGG